MNDDGLSDGRSAEGQRKTLRHAVGKTIRQDAVTLTLRREPDRIGKGRVIPEPRHDMEVQMRRAGAEGSNVDLPWLKLGPQRLLKRNHRREHRLPVFDR